MPSDMTSNTVIRRSEVKVIRWQEKTVRIWGLFKFKSRMGEQVNYLCAFLFHSYTRERHCRFYVLFKTTLLCQLLIYTIIIILM